MKAHLFERGDSIFLVAPVTPIKLDEDGIGELAFAEQIKRVAPNPNILWLQGRYVESERANANKQQWREGDIAIKSLQPVFMPVTIMHDYRTAVGLIADTKLLTPETASVPRSRIDTTLGIWAHRFPDIAEEIDANYSAGTLMQSMECTSPHYECSVCSQLYHKLPGGAEREHWCEHLLGTGSVEAARILGGVTFTGTGLIFGSHEGARGAYDEAHLDVFEEAVAEYHERAHKDTGKPRSRRRTSMDEITVSKVDYDALQQRPTKEALEAAEKKAADAEAKLAESESKLEAAEADAKKKGEDLEAAEKKVTDSEEAQKKTELRDERLGKLGEGFVAKLGETAKRRMKEQAGEMSDEDWTARIEELSEMAGVKSDEGKKKDKGKGSGSPSNGNGDGEFSSEEIARAGVGGGAGDGSEEEETAQTDASRRSVVGKLMGNTTGAKNDD